jgi:hypothetical protein
VSTPLTEQIRAYFDDADRQQGAVDIAAVRRSVEEAMIVLELAQDDARPPDAPTEAPTGRRWPIMIAAAAAAVAVVAALAFRPNNEPEVVPSDEPDVAPWSAELLVRPLDPPIACQPELCPSLAVSPEGTLVAHDLAANTLTWYEDEPRVVPITTSLSGDEFEGDPQLLAIGPHDVAYFQASRPNESSYVPDLVAISPSGAEIRRVRWTSWLYGVDQTSAGLTRTWCRTTANRCVGGPEWPSPDASLVMPWVDLAGNPITDTRPYPVATDTDAGIEVRLGEREWLLTEEQLYGHSIPVIVPRSDGGAVMLLDETLDDLGQPIKLLELLSDGTIERYVVDWSAEVLPDGSAIVEHNGQLVRLTPPT